MPDRYIEGEIQHHGILGLEIGKLLVHYKFSGGEFNSVWFSDYKLRYFFAYDYFKKKSKVIRIVRLSLKQT